jgi:NAD(P)-dependent dehydrogenase (short-subunit alcohol dehydrogenase family)
MKLQDILADGIFSDKTVVVTGGGSGINFGIARAFAELGANVAICGRTQLKLEKAAATLKETGAEVFACVADVREPEAVDSFLEGTKTALGSAHIVVAGAAGNFLCLAKDMSPNGFKTVVDIDLIGTFNTAKAAYGQLRETSGSMLMISAAQAFMPFAFQAHAGAAKAGVEQLMRQLALEWGQDGVRVNAIVPGPVEGTEGLARLSATSLHKTLIDTIPMGRLGRAEDISAAAVFLASPLASYTTGTTMIVDGGQFLSGTGVLNNATASLFNAA